MESIRIDLSLNNEELIDFCEERWWDNTDIFFYSGEINYQASSSIISQLESYLTENESVLFLLCTFGGDADAAYRIAKYLHVKYKTVSIGVFGFCKSAGTLIAVSADRLVMGCHGELGPLDVQMYTPDEFVLHTSGMALSQGLAFLQERAFRAFEVMFLSLRGNSGGIITTGTAAEIATSLVRGIYGPIAEKIDPMVAGDMQRSLEIAIQYGVRLGVRKDVIQNFTMNYPSHGFVIDREEAARLLGEDRVVEPSIMQRLITMHINDACMEYCRKPILMLPADRPILGMVNIQYTMKDDTNECKGDDVLDEHPTSGTEAADWAEQTQPADGADVSIPSTADRPMPGESPADRKSTKKAAETADPAGMAVTSE